MLKIGFELGSNQPPLRVLCLGAHCDDIELGCGGTVLMLAERFPQARVDWIVFASDPVREAEAKRSAAAFLKGFGEIEVSVLQFRESFFPYIGTEIKEAFEDLKQRTKPDIVFTHYRHDRHQDHRVISDLTWNTFRDHLILEYEILKYDGDLGTPGLFVPLTEEIVERRLDLLFDCFPSQLGKTWFSRDALGALSRLRGVECNAATGLAEAFYCRKLVL